MTHKEDWLTRQFDFDFPTSRYQEFLESLRAAPEHLESLVAGLSVKDLTHRDGDSWSIQENAGHLLSGEELFSGRLEDYGENVRVLRPAVFEDNPTDKANYNQKEFTWILAEFRRQRGIYMKKLDRLQPQAFGKTALHPRLGKPMRLCDMLYFHTEHDRHHLARIEELKAVLGVD